MLFISWEAFCSANKFPPLRKQTGEWCRALERQEVVVVLRHRVPGRVRGASDTDAGWSSFPRLHPFHVREELRCIPHHRWEGVAEKAGDSQC